MRLFTAIELPPDARTHAGKVIEELHRQWTTLSPPREPNWTAGENLHITLKFLGEFADADVPALCEALQHAASSPAQVRFDRIVCFPAHGPARIVAGGLSGDVEALKELFASIEAQCAALRVPLEGRAFTPHIILDALPDRPRCWPLPF